LFANSFSTAEGDQLPRSMNKLLLIEARLEFRYSEAESF